ncbi:hypothetical protein AcW1_001844 [Taiwanofungus camphoratus]|nr:hypothetical protein AcV7_001696 [Antrodia cinnamomea]KAI0945679.1 hypothetical protein AcW1_001844 [Antrodia cinnamomea]
MAPPFAQNGPDSSRRSQSLSSSQAGQSGPLSSTARKSGRPQAPERGISFAEQSFMGNNPSSEGPSQPGRGRPSLVQQRDHQSRLFVTKTAPHAANRRRPPPVARAEHHPLAGPRVPARKISTPNRAAESSFSFVAPLQSHFDRPTKSSPVPPPWMAHWMQTPRGVRKRGENDIGGRSAPRMMVTGMSSQQRSKAAGPRPLQAHRNRYREDTPTRGGFVVEPGLILRKLHENDDEGIVNTQSGAPRLAKGARKIAYPPILGTKSARNFDGQTATKRAGLATKAARKSQIEDADSDAIEVPDTSSSEADTDEEEEDVEQLMAALDSLTIKTVRLKEYRQLPFLLRNLRRGFRHRCQLAGVTTGPKQLPSAPVSILYRYCLDDDELVELDANGREIHQYAERMGSTREWECPLCPLHGQFNTREMLQFHLRRDHQEVKVIWTRPEDHGGQAWHLELTIPDVELEPESDDDEDEEEEEEEEQGAPPRTEAESVAQGQARTPSPVVPLATPEPLVAPSPSSSIIPKKFRAYSPTPSTTTYADTRSRSVTLQTAKTASSRGSLPSRYPTPPPQSDPLGPSAQYPYLPETPIDGEIYYSCRPGGPKIYDLLNTLPLEPFGVLSWQIVDREEELFEMDDVRDEDKVILALWNRWIMLNRRAFIFEGYCKGLIDFIDQYWLMIHRAAGWSALRAFLLMLVANRFLDVSEVVQILKHYETHTGMDYWYKDDSELSEVS